MNSFVVMIWSLIPGASMQDCGETNWVSTLENEVITEFNDVLIVRCLERTEKKKKKSNF